MSSTHHTVEPPWTFSKAAQADFEKLATTVRFHDSERIHSVNDPAADMLYLAQGSVEISAVSAQGRENLLMFLRPGHWWGEIGLFDHGARTHNATARGEVTLLKVPNPVFLDYADAHPEIYRQIGAVFSRRMRLALMGIDYLTLMSLRQRTAMRVVTLVEEEGPTLHLSQENLARMVGGTREALGRVLHDWKQQELISTRRGSLTVNDIEALRSEAEL